MKCNFDCPYFGRIVIDARISLDGREHIFEECSKKREEIKSLIVEEPGCQVVFNCECMYYKWEQGKQE